VVVTTCRPERSEGRRTYYVYILASKSRRLYTGVTNNLVRRLDMHRSGKVVTTRRYRITRLVYVETTNDIRAAITREKEITAWRREKKLTLVSGVNPAWDDLVLDWRVTGSARNPA
jgi:putative endonuclease